MTNREKFKETFNKDIHWSRAIEPQILALKSAHIDGIDCMEEWLNSEYEPQKRNNEELRQLKFRIDQLEQGLNHVNRALEQEPKTIQEKQAESEKYQKAFDDGYANGYAQARFDYEQDPCDNCKYLDGDGCRLVFEQSEYGKASDECPNDNNVSTKNTVSRGVFEQVRWERDVAISQLKELGYEFGEKIEPCEDCISRQAVLNYIYNDLGLGDEENGKDVERQMELDESYRYIKSLPPVTPQPKTGHWIRVTDNKEHLVWECDKCGWQQRFNTNFCPDCGCHMFEPQESEDQG